MAGPPRPEVQLAALYQRVIRRMLSMAAAAKTGGRRRFIEGQVRGLADMLSELGDRELAWVQEHVPAQYARAARQAQYTLQQGGVPILEARFTGVDRASARALAQRVSTDLANIRVALQTGLQLGDPRVAAREIEAALRGDNQLVRLADGRLSVKVPSGKFWRPDVYSRMLGRTGIADARRVAFRQRYLSNGIDLVRVVPNGSAHPVCRRWEGRTLSLTGQTPGYPTAAAARAAGLWHPNCAHRYVVDTSRPQPGIPLEQPKVPLPAAPLPILGRQPSIPQAQLPSPVLPAG